MRVHVLATHGQLFWGDRVKRAICAFFSRNGCKAWEWLYFVLFRFDININCKMNDRGSRKEKLAFLRRLSLELYSVGPIHQHQQITHKIPMSFVQLADANWLFAMVHDSHREPTQIELLFLQTPNIQFTRIHLMGNWEREWNIIRKCISCKANKLI